MPSFSFPASPSRLWCSQCLHSVDVFAQVLKQGFISAVPAVAKIVIYAASIFFLATAGATMGLIIGAILHPKTLCGFSRGIGVGTIFGAVYSIKFFKCLILWCTDEDSDFLLPMENAIQMVRGNITSRYRYRHSNLNQKVSETTQLTTDVLARRGTDDISCSICLQDLQPGEVAGDLRGCQHLYHIPCLQRWLKERSTCPLCRTRVTNVMNW